MDVGDQVAVGVGVARFWRVGHVGGEAFGGGKAWAFTDEKDDDAGGEQVADLVHQANAAVANDEWLAEGPPSGPHLLIKRWQ